MLAAVQHEAGAPLQIERLPLPLPGPGEVLVRMHAAPINPSDLATLQGGYLDSPYPLIPGLEGSGQVVASGQGLLASMRLGKTVACTPNPGGGGSWAAYMRCSAMRCVPLPKACDPIQGAMMLVNPMTALALIRMAEEEKHKAVVNNAAASALGKMLIKLAVHRHIPLINIVRKQAQVDELLELGAVHVLNSTSPDFESALSNLSHELNATLFLDAVTGPATAQLLRCAPEGSTLLAYARLSGEELSADPAQFISQGKSIRGFQLGNFLRNKSLLYKLRMTAELKKLHPSLLGSKIHTSFALSEVNKAIAVYRENMSAGKIILKPSSRLNGDKEAIY